MVPIYKSHKPLKSTNDSLSHSFNLYSCQKKHKIKKCFVYSKKGHSENVQFLKSATTFFSEKTRKSSLKHNAAKPKIIISG